jgi:hypothetical protein
VPPDSVRCTRGLQAELLTFGKMQRRSAIIHRTVRCTIGQCPVPQGRATLNSSASGIRSAIIHRTCPVHTGLSGELAEQRLLRAQRSTATHLMRACARRGQSTLGWHTGQSTGLVRCTTGQPEAPQVRAPTVEPQRSADVAGAPDSVWWRTGLSGAPCDSTLPTAIFGGWGYKYPNHPTFNGIQVSTLLHLTRAITFNTRHTKVIKSSPNSTQSFSD